MSEPHTEFNDDHIPIAYFITFRAYGTWLHGDSRGSVDRFHKAYGSPMLPASVLWAFNIRTNHVHSVVSADCKPEPILSALKANATRSMRESGCWKSDRSPWVYRGSKRYLWTEKELLDAVAYVTYGQGEPLQNPER